MVTDVASQPKQLNLSGLNGISDQALDLHVTLYEGYVQETNRLTERIGEFLKDGRADHEERAAHGRRLLPAWRCTSPRGNREQRRYITRPGKGTEAADRGP